MWTTLINTLGGLGSLFLGGRNAKESNIHDEQSAVLDGYRAEYMGDRPNRNWWDSFVDGLNRLIRPAVTLGAAWLVFFMPFFMPDQFIILMTAYGLVPEALWVLVGGIFAFWFGPRSFEKLATAKWTVDRKEAREIRTEIEYDREMADTTKPLSNATILEWNRRNNERSQ